MAAVMVEQLEPEGLGHELLEEWGQWMRDDRAGRESWAVKPRIAAGYHGDPPDRVNFVDRLIAVHRLKYRDDWRVIAQFYLDDRRPWEIAGRMRCAEGRVRAVLLHMCGMVEREYRDWRNGLDSGIFPTTNAGKVRPR